MKDKRKEVNMNIEYKINISLSEEEYATINEALHTLDNIVGELTNHKDKNESMRILCEETAIVWIELAHLLRLLEGESEIE